MTLERFDPLVMEAVKAIREDISYTYAVATAAQSIRSKMAAKQKRSVEAENISEKAV